MLSALAYLTTFKFVQENNDQAGDAVKMLCNVLYMFVLFNAFGRGFEAKACSTSCCIPMVPVRMSKTLARRGDIARRMLCLVV